jgi:hypothetical protein
MHTKSVPRWKSRTRAYPYSACLKVHFPRPKGGLAAERRAAALISGDDFECRSLFRNDYNMEYRFRKGAQAHAMHVWFEANGPEYDEWAEKVASWEATDGSLTLLPEQLPPLRPERHAVASHPFICRRTAQASREAGRRSGDNQAANNLLKRKGRPLGRATLCKDG